jgi:hypothetical protein
MRFDVTLPDLVASCCDNLVYAIVFNKDGQALKDNGFGVLTFQPYTFLTHPDFAIILDEDAERSKYYFKDIIDANLSLADNPKGECYQVEYWLRPVAGTFDRAADELRDTRRIVVSKKKLVDATLSAEGVKELANVQAHLSAVFDSENLILRFMSHLDQNGELVTTTTQCQIIVTDKTGADIINVTDGTYLSNHAGIFSIEIPNINLANDQVFVAKAIITDADGLDHHTVSYLNTWD